MNPAPSRWGLGTRFVVLFLGLLLVIQAAGFATIGAAISANARAQVAGELDVGERALQRLLAQDVARLTDAARVLASDWGFRDAVASGDLETIRSALDNHGGRINASVTALFDTGFQLRAASAVHLDALAAAAAQAAERRRGGEAAAIVALWNGVPTQFVLAPLRTPLPAGWVLMGFALDRRLGDDLAAISSVELALLARDRADLPWRSTVTRLAPALDADLRAAAAAPGTAEGVALAGVEYGLRRTSLAAGPGGEVQAALLRSVEAAARPWQQLQWLLLAITLGGVLAFALGAIVTARHVTGPVRRLVEAAQRLGGGDLATPVRGVRRGDEIGNLAQAFESMRQSLHGQQAALERLAFRDPLTGLPNRVRFAADVRTAVAAADPARERLAVLMLDLDRFKHVNHVLGDAVGDRVLQGVAERLRMQVKRDADVLARLSADEFALLLPGCGPDEALAVAARIAAAFEQPLRLPEQAIDLSAGVGIACWPQHATDAEALLARAEVAMSAAKRRAAGARLYDPADDSGSAQTLSLLGELKHAVEHDELRLFLQPKIALRDGRLLGAEALLRWQHPTRGLLPPVHFVPFAEQTGFIGALTQWVFERAARQWHALSDVTGAALRLSVNLSTRDLLDPALPEQLATVLARHAVPTDAFCLEITESAIMDDPQRAEATLRRLAERGFKIAIDDFGTGHSSLAYLKRLPVSELKIDKSFVMGMVRDAGDAKIVRSTVDLAHNLGLTVVAEGVEDASIWNALHRLACDEAQGYHLSRPLDVDAFGRWTQRWIEKVASGWGGLETVIEPA